MVEFRRMIECTDFISKEMQLKFQYLLHLAHLVQNIVVLYIFKNHILQITTLIVYLHPSNVLRKVSLICAFFKADCYFQKALIYISDHDSVQRNW